LSNKKIATNTVYLFARTVFSLGSQLLGVRIILGSFGQDLFGIYTVLYGVVTIGSLIPSSLVSTSLRYHAFSLGKNDDRKNRQILFTSQLTLFAIGAILSLVLLDSIGLWFITQRLSFPGEYADQVFSFFRLTELAILLNILSSPFLGLLIAHEDLKIYSRLSSIEPVLKLISAIIIALLAQSKLLTNYGFGLFASSMVSTVITVLVTSLKYREAIPNFKLINLSLIRDLSRFALWTMFGQVTSASRNQLVTIFIYQFFTPAIAASRGLSLTISNHINLFAENLNTALYAPITKSYSQNKLNEMHQTIFTGSKLTFILNSVFSLPLIYNIDIILSSWLGRTTPYLSILTQLGLWESLLVSLSFPLMTAARAPGKVAEYELKLGGLQLMIPIVTFYIFKNNYPVYFCYIASIIGILIMTVARLLFLKKLIQFDIKKYYLYAMQPCCNYIVLTSIFINLAKKLFPNLLYFNLILTTIITVLVAYIIVLTHDEKRNLLSFLRIKLSTLFA
jgi:O-antigen/teichoic acid export membrane protein